MSPLVMSTSRPFWCRIPRKNVFYYRSAEHENNFILSFAVCFDREDDIYYFCYCYPYTYTQLQRYLNRISQMHSVIVKRELLGMSLGLRRLDLLTITDPRNSNLFGLPKKRIVFVTARVHPGESPSSYVCQGLIDFLTSSHPIAKQLRLHLVFMIVPMLNPDGVFFGNHRSSLLGFDLNRHWQEPLPVAQPTIHSVKNLLASLDKFDSTNLDFFVDIHAHSTLTNGFMYGNVYEDEERNERESLLPHLLSRCAEDFSLSQTDYNNHSVKAGTGRRAVGGMFGPRTLCYTLEVSFYSYTNSKGVTIPYTEDRYCRLGRNLALTFYEFYQHQGLFSKRSYRRHRLSRSLSSSLGNLSVARTDKQHSDGEGQSPSGASLKLPPHSEDVSTPELDLSARRLPGRDSDTLSLQETELLMDDFSNCFEKAVASDANMCN